MLVSLHQSSLTAQLTYCPGRYRRGLLADCTVAAEQFRWQTRRGEFAIQYADCLSVSSSPAPRFGFIVYACPFVQRFRGRRCDVSRPASGHRTLQLHRFVCTSAQQQAAWIEALTARIHQHRPRLERLLVVINRNCGQGQGLKRWQTVQPLFQYAQILTDIIQPDSRDQLYAALTDANLTIYQGVVVVGGDGTVHDVFNALGQHSDPEAGHLPIGIIPAGTGNGLCKSILAQSKEPFSPMGAAFITVRGHPHPLDQLEVQQGDNRYQSLLSLAWGLISDIDLESDRWRWLGPLRTDLYALYCIARLRTYTGQVQIQTHAQAPWQRIDGAWIALWVMNVPWATAQVRAAPSATLADGLMTVIWVRAGVSRWQLMRAFLQLETGEYLKLPGIECTQAQRLRLVPQALVGNIAMDGESLPTEPLELSVAGERGYVFCF